MRGLVGYLLVKDVYENVIFYTQNFANFDPKKIRQRNVHVGRIMLHWRYSFWGMVRLAINMTLAWADCVAYPWERQCEGLSVG